MGHMVSFRGEKAFHIGVHLENSGKQCCQLQQLFRDRVGFELVTLLLVAFLWFGISFPHDSIFSRKIWKELFFPYDIVMASKEGYQKRKSDAIKVISRSSSSSRSDGWHQNNLPNIFFFF